MALFKDFFSDVCEYFAQVKRKLVQILNIFPCAIELLLFKKEKQLTMSFLFLILYRKAAKYDIFESDYVRIKGKSDINVCVW